MALRLRFQSWELVKLQWILLTESMPSFMIVMSLSNSVMIYTVLAR